jgi:diphosphomevalonate decarboxylase
MTGIQTATALAHPNIAFIKYWGDRDTHLRIPANSSISMNLAGLTTRTTVRFDPRLEGDHLILNGRHVGGQGLERVRAVLELVRQMAERGDPAEVSSQSNFPVGAGIASSAAGFAALALAASAAAGLDLDERQLSRLARRGSGSASRSVPGGFVYWEAGQDDESSYAYSIAPAGHWQLVDCIVLVSREHKSVGSTAGHTLAVSSPLQATRVADAALRLEICKRAILERDFEALASIVELDSNLMHAVMMTSSPPLLYWQPATLAVMQRVVAMRQSGLPAGYTIDAGPNVHVICPEQQVEQVMADLQRVPGVERVLTARPGGKAHLI